ncbi:hypothetical protein DDZ14_12835 [Maritimibacter sp. 55A14]|uniref:dynamin family protein n=1 Tax=Maritimibacter sp. 55A14 TaxID=2174844 RepID=UPI000D61FBE2|nr:dynamin family protein [Maritimibacter sp. 55A14]PWE31394.1 hypothetical protein DDZ14_12835 [Maritimibacter sp. 55A14]
MNIADIPTPGTGVKQRKPRIAFMGEFSAGKSTLTNMLIGADPLPVKVTATQLPPVWVSYGDQSAFREDNAGNVGPFDLNNIDSISPDETRVIRIFQKCDILELCDLIDMPGISDPNMSPELWQNVIEHADLVIWCTHATQAWRQSEAAVWDTLDPKLYSRSLLLLTRYDKLLNDKDRKRVLRRVRHETDGLFGGYFPISLTQAIAAKDDREEWERSGAEAFMERLVELLHEVAAELESGEDGSAVRPAREMKLDRIEPETGPDETDADIDAEAEPARPRVMPRRVRPVATGQNRTRRPDPEDAATSPPDGEPSEVAQWAGVRPIRQRNGTS